MLRLCESGCSKQVCNNVVEGVQQTFVDVDNSGRTHGAVAVTAERRRANSYAAGLRKPPRTGKLREA